ncbi:hypothetical protein VSDG_03265 [Cytospora chrysosperma]|uniref:Uncharacterized protein n=1 Tax=Cytospora chrysosperma TaxID=252740 RepID=A0A423WBA5_CYTCH|nr:hypothetical protein VSDG_03265 [Valsa sordida]
MLPPHFPTRLLLLVGITGSFPLAAQANVEKTIFLGPEPLDVPQHQQRPALAGLNLDVLTPESSWSLRTRLDATFPAAGGSERGTPAWLLLDDLVEGQRYEVRICWLATPTEFHLETYTLPAVFEDPELTTSLYNYSMARQPSSPSSPPPPPTPKEDHQSSSPLSTLFLRVDAAADYFTTDRALMARPEPVLVDIILDPFVLNVLPRTLVPTVGYLVLVAALSWVLSTRLVMPWLRGLMVEESSEAEQQEERKKQ